MLFYPSGAQQVAKSLPRISVVIAAYNVENFISVAVVSAIEQLHAFDEIIVIDDASTDRTGEIIDEIATENPLVTVIHSAANVGLGEVRNLGMDTATGDYICFLDGDDYFLPEAVACLHAQLSEKPDVVLYNHARFYPNGEIMPNVMMHLLIPALHHSVNARKALFSNLNVAWNKLYSRDFLTRSGLRFPEGKYEDIAWNYMCLMLANEIVTTPAILTHYRQRDGSILHTSNMTHFDIFERWDELFQQMSAYPHLVTDYGDLLKVRRFKSLGVVLDHPRRVPRNAKIKFAKRMRAVCGPFKALPKRDIGALEQVWDFPGGAYLRLYLKAAPITWARSLFAFVKQHRNIHKILIYRFIFLRLPVDPDLVVYQSYWGQKVACNPYAIFKYLQQLEHHLIHVWVVKNGTDLRGTAHNATHVTEHSLRYYYTMARAGILINNANFPDEIMKRQGSIHVQTKHGTPLKYMGLDQLRLDPKAFVDPDAFAVRCARWDYVISSNRYSTDVWRRSFPYNYQVIETGYPRNDRLIATTDAEQSELRDQLGLPAQAEVVLYAPTFRSSHFRETEQERETILAGILSGLKPGQILAVRDHYYVKAGRTLVQDPRLFDLTGVPSTTEVMLVTDLLITDYSSIMFDFAVRKKPIIVFAPDLSQYRAARGTYFDISQDHPGVYCATLPELIQALADRAYDTTEAKAKQDAFHTRFCHLDDGHAAERACTIILDRQKKA
ncbi:MAG: CDP-glycerol glycerophosphotransferase family protein [Yoonia sp.]|uniref:bifunctional glycosyltransferase/CDP-glycerol:glycerophosphate glycerophosphotransferase n=1 Tax=Yoonia sp. TaxID=2212373 RepID=UPI0032630D4F